MEDILTLFAKWKIFYFFLVNGRRPQLFSKMEDNLKFVNKWKTTSNLVCKWKTIHSFTNGRRTQIFFANGKRPKLSF